MAKKKKPGAMTVSAAMVMAECAFETGRGLQRGAGARPFLVEAPARAFWLSMYARTIRQGLKRPGADWEGRDRQNVLPRCVDLGAIAAQLAMAATPGTGVFPVTRAHAEEASRRVQGDRRCRAAKGKPGREGAGGYCDG